MIERGAPHPAGNGPSAASTGWARLVPRSRRGRRLAVVAFYGGYAAVVAVLWGRAAAGAPSWLSAFSIVPGVAMLAGMVVLSSKAAGVYDVANQPPDKLDERQQRVGDHAYRVSYWVVGAALIVGVVYVQVATDAGWWLPRSDGAMQALTWATILLTGWLPTAAVAWTEPDPPDLAEP